MKKKSKITTSSAAIVLIFSVWLFFSPFVFGYSYLLAMPNDLAIGLVISVFTVISSFYPSKYSYLKLVNVLLGTWLIFAPFVLGYSSPYALWNDVISGFAIAVISLWMTI
ncbi:hypothetical protein C4569_03485 [Candidatus Parcubacteria bacterium]|nr:MAG: hypothetical protein C4569_03485 [Candidatus Parcubacteria bacterium]